MSIHPDILAAAREWRDKRDREARALRPRAKTGYQRDDGSWTVIGDAAHDDGPLTDNLIYVTLQDRSIATVYAPTFGRAPNVDVELEWSPNGYWQIYGLDAPRATDALGPAAAAAAEPPVQYDQQPAAQFGGINFKPGRLKVVSGLVVTLEGDFEFTDTASARRTWEGELSGTLDLTSSVPAAVSGVNQWRYVLITLNPDATTPALVATTGTAKFYTQPLTTADADAIAAPSGHWPAWIVALKTGDTTLPAINPLGNPTKTWRDLRFFATSGGGSVSPLTTKGDLYTYGTGNARLPVGTDGKVLTANSAATYGIEWQTPATPTVDAADVTYTPADATDWNSGTDPGDTGDALDQLADRVTVAESDIAALTTGGITSSGWVAAGETWTYASADDPTYTFTISGDLTTKYSAGMRIRLSQSTGGTKYFIVTKVAYSAPDTTLTIYGGTDYDLNNEAISNPYFSVVKAPYGMPLNSAKWTVKVTDTSDRSQATPTQNVWYNLGTTACQITIPIGVWRVSYQVTIEAFDASSAGWTVYSTLSTANNSESDSEMSAFGRSTAVAVDFPVFRERQLTLTAKTTYYLNSRTGNTNLDALHFRNDQVPLVMRAICDYL